MIFTVVFFYQTLRPEFLYRIPAVTFTMLLTDDQVTVDVFVWILTTGSNYHHRL